MSAWIDDPRSWIALIAAVAGWASATAALLNAKTARSQLRIARAQFADKQPQLDVGLIEAAYEVTPRGRSYSISLLVRNPSDRANSISRALLEVNYRDTAGSPQAAQFEVSPAGLPRELTLPVPMTPGNSVSGVLHALVPEGALRGMKVDDYTLVVIDAFANENSVEMVLVREIRAGGGTP